MLKCVNSALSAWFPPCILGQILLSVLLCVSIPGKMSVSFRSAKMREEFVMGQIKEGQRGELRLPCSKGDLYVQGKCEKSLVRGITTVIEHHQKSLCEHSLGMCIWNKWFHFEMTCVMSFRCCRGKCMVPLKEHYISPNHFHRPVTPTWQSFFLYT